MLIFFIWMYVVQNISIVNSNMYLRFADKLNAKVSNDAETRFEIGFSLQDALVDVKMILSIFVFNLR